MEDNILCISIFHLLSFILSCLYILPSPLLFLFSIPFICLPYFLPNANSDSTQNYFHTNCMWMTLYTQPRTNIHNFCLVLSSRWVYMGNLTFYYFQPHSTCQRPKSTCHQNTPIHKFMFKNFITQEKLEIYHKLSYSIQCILI